MWSCPWWLGQVTEDFKAGLAVSLDVTVATTTSECGSDFLKQLVKNGVCA